MNIFYKQNKEQIEKILPEQYCKYLEGLGWVKIGEYPNKASVWEKTHENNKVGVHVPISTRFDDYILRIMELLNKLEIVENKSKEEIIKEILNCIKMNNKRIKFKKLFYRFLKEGYPLGDDGTLVKIGMNAYTLGCLIIDKLPNDYDAPVVMPDNDNDNDIDNADLSITWRKRDIVKVLIVNNNFTINILIWYPNTDSWTSHENIPCKLDINSTYDDFPKELKDALQEVNK